MTKDQDHALVDRVLAGEQRAYALLVDKHKRFAYTIALKVLDNKSDAEEAAQDAFIKAFRYLSSFKQDSKFSTWLYRIVFNTAISRKRKNKTQFEAIETKVIAYQGAEPGLEHDDKKKYIAMAMQKLSEADRVALTLFYLEEFSLEEIAEVTGMQANTAKVRVHRARQRLGEELKLLLKKEALTL